MDTAQSGAISITNRLAALRHHSTPPGKARIAPNPAHPNLQARGCGDEQRRWALALRRLSRLEQLIELDAPDVVLRNEWRLVSVAFSSLEHPETATGMPFVA